MEDEFLKKKKVLVDLESQDDYYSLGLKYAEINDNDVELLARFIQDLYMSAGAIYGKHISRDASTHFKGAMFSLGTNETEVDKDWRGHTASSLREILYVWNDTPDFFESYKRIDGSNFDTLEQTDKDLCVLTCKRMKYYYGYFSGVTHQDFNNICYKYRDLAGGAVGQNYEDCIKKEVFIKQVVNFFREMKTLLERVNPVILSRYETT